MFSTSFSVGAALGCVELCEEQLQIIMVRKEGEMTIRRSCRGNDQVVVVASSSSPNVCKIYKINGQVWAGLVRRLI